MVEIGRKLVETHAAAGQWQLAENLLLNLQLTAGQQLWSIDRLARLWQQAGLSADAAHFYQVLDRELARQASSGQPVAEPFTSTRPPAGEGPAPSKQPICDWKN